MRIQALGGYRIVVDGRDLRLRTRKEAMLLLRLALAGDTGVSRDECIGLLWPDSSEARARHSLSEALRGIELAARIEVARTPERLSLPASSFSFDVRELDDAIARGDVHACAELHKGGFLAGWYPPTAEASHWVDGVAAGIVVRMEKMLRSELVTRRHATDSGGVIAVVRLLESIGAATPIDREALSEAEQLAGWDRLRSGQGLAVIPMDREGPFVGRSEEMKALTSELERAMEGELRVVLLAGEPGIGKTRTCQRLARIAALRGARLLMSSCYELEQSIPYQAIGEALRDVVGTSDVELLKSDQRGALSHLVGDTRQNRSNRPTDRKPVGDAEKRTVHEAVTALVHAASASRTLVFHIDDLQWADASSCQAMHYVLRSAKPKAGALFLFAFRTDEIRENGAASSLVRSLEPRAPTRLQLSSLPPDELRKHLELLWPEGAQRVDDVVALAAGNPFFARELAMAAANGTRDEPVGSLSEAILSRADRLPSLERTLADVIAVWGSPVTPFHLARLLEENIATVIRALSELRVQRLIKEVGADVSTAHELTRQALYASLSEPIRRSLHAAIACAMESSAPPPFLAHHFGKAMIRDKACVYANAAASSSRKKKAYLEELRWLLLALENTDAGSAGVLEEVVDRMFALAQYTEISRLLTSYTRYLTPAVRMKGELARLRASIATPALYKQLLTDCDRLFAKSSASGYGNVAIDALRVKMRLAQELVDTETTLQVVEDLSAFAQTITDPEIKLQAEATSLMKLTSFRPTVVETRLTTLRTQFIELGMPGEQLERSLGVPDALNDYNHGRYRAASLKLHRLVRDARQAGSWGEEVRVRTLLVPMSTEMGRFRRALRHARFVIDASRSSDTRWERWITVTNVATCYFEMQDYRASMECADQAIAAEDEYPMWLIRVHPVALKGLCALVAGDLDSALRHRDQLREMLPSPSDWIGDLSYVVMLLARVEAVVRENQDGAVSILKEAVSSERGFPRIYYWHVDLEWARLGLLNEEEARERTRQVRTEALACGCHLVAHKAERLLAERLSSEL